MNRVVPRDQLDEEALTLAKKIAEASGDTLALGKRTFYEQLPLERAQAYVVAERAMVENAGQPDAQGGDFRFSAKAAAAVAIVSALACDWIAHFPAARRWYDDSTDPLFRRPAHVRFSIRGETVGYDLGQTTSH